MQSTAMKHVCQGRVGQRAPTRRCSKAVKLSAQTTQAPAETGRSDGRAVRRSLNDTGRYTRRPKDDPVSLTLMEDHGVGYSSTGLVARMRQEGHKFTADGITVKLATAYGYCWGVERAVQMAYEARQAFPDRKLHITNEIIHNPEVNERLSEMQVNIIVDTGSGKDFSNIGNGDVVIFPAFGASVEEMKYFRDHGVQMVDTTCPWVSKVWNSVDNYARKTFTSVIHGKYYHEETIATASFADRYIVVKNMAEAQEVCDYVMNGGDRDAFMKKYAKATSAGFDPDTMLDRVGIANQTTMLKTETEQVGKLFEKTMMQKFGPENLNQHFIVMDTICDATQERQDAMYSLVDDPELDIMIVVGGFNSSNTNQLQQIAELKGLKSFWVDSAARIDVASNKVAHKTSYGELLETENWIPEGPLTVGITSGASTPDRAVETVLEKLFAIRNPGFAGFPQLETPARVQLPPH